MQRQEGTILLLVTAVSSLVTVGLIQVVGKEMVLSEGKFIIKATEASHWDASLLNLGGYSGLTCSRDVKFEGQCLGEEGVNAGDEFK